MRKLRLCPHGVLGVHKCKQCEKERLRKYNSIPEVKERNKERFSTPEFKAKKKEYDSTPEAKARRKELRSIPETKERIKERRSTPEYKAKKREYDKEYWNRPEVKEKSLIAGRKFQGIPVNHGIVPVGKCPICENIRTLVPDHCHITGKLRGWLCGICNRSLGFYEKFERNGNVKPYLNGEIRIKSYSEAV